MFLSLFEQNPVAAVAFVAGILAGIVVHEASHASSAYSLGDDTAYRDGRVTLNPAAHLELLSVLMIFLVGVGWGRTPVTPSKLRGGVWGQVAVAAAGPVSNLLIVALCAVLLKLPPFEGGYWSIVVWFWRTDCSLSSTSYRSRRSTVRLFSTRSCRALWTDSRASCTSMGL